MSTSDPPYRFEDAQGYSVIVVQPKLNDSQWSEFENVGNELLRRIQEAKSPAYLVDLSGLSYMGSAMVALIVRLWKGVKERGGKMVVINRHPMVFEVMKLAGLHNVWTIADSREDALKQLGKRGEPGDTSGALVAVGALGVVAGLVGLGVMFGFIPLLKDKPQIVMALTAVGAVLALGAGAVCAAKKTGGKQKVGIVFAVLGAAILIAAFVKMAGGNQNQPQGGTTPAPSQPANATNDAVPAQPEIMTSLQTGKKGGKRIKEEGEAKGSADKGDSATPEAGDAKADESKEPAAEPNDGKADAAASAADGAKESEAQPGASTTPKVIGKFKSLNKKDK